MFYNVNRIDGHGVVNRYPYDGDPASDGELIDKIGEHYIQFTNPHNTEGGNVQLDDSPDSYAASPVEQRTTHEIIEDVGIEIAEGVAGALSNIATTGITAVNAMDAIYTDSDTFDLTDPYFSWAFWDGYSGDDYQSEVKHLVHYEYEQPTGEYYTHYVQPGFLTDGTEPEPSVSWQVDIDSPPTPTSMTDQELEEHDIRKIQIPEEAREKIKDKLPSEAIVNGKVYVALDKVSARRVDSADIPSNE